MRSAIPDTAVATKSKKRIGHIPEDVNPNLSECQTLFCWLYVYDKDCYCNATASYMRAYDLKDSQRRVAQSAGSRLLSNVVVRKYINKMLVANFKDDVVDTEHSRLIMQNRNPLAKLGAIQEYNKIKKRLEQAPVASITFGWKEPSGPKHPVTPSKPNAVPPSTPPAAKDTKGKFTIEFNQ